MSEQPTDISNTEEQFELSDREFLKTRDAYNHFMQCLTEVIPESVHPTFEQWVDYVDEDKAHSLGAAFVPPSGAMPAAMAAGGGLAAQIGSEAMKAMGFNGNARDTADKVLNNMRQKAEEAIRSRVRATASTMFEQFDDEGDGGTSKANYQGGTFFNPTGLSQSLKPIDTSFNTDIPFEGQTRYWQDGKEHSGPLLIKCGVPGLVSPVEDSFRDAELYDFLNGPIQMTWNREIAKRVTWTGRVKNLLTEAQIINYLNRCLSVCCTYYFWRSIIVFTDDSRNRNAGMDQFRANLTPSDYNNLFNLRREMMQCAIPPFVHEFAFYMMGTYSQSHLPTSPLMKIMPFSFATTSNMYFDGTLKTYTTDNLSAVDLARGHLNQMKEFNNILSRAIGSWGGVEPFEYRSAPRVDMDYTTFWTNANYVATNGSGVQHFPKMETNSDELFYNIHTDAPDGWLQSMVTPLVLANTDYGVGLFHSTMLDQEATQWMTTNSNYGNPAKSTSCFVFNQDTHNGAFWPIESSNTYQTLSGNTFTTTLTSSVYHYFQKFSTERVILLSVNALRRANFQFLDLLYTKDLMNLPLQKRNMIVGGKEDSPKGNGNFAKGNKSRRGRSSKMPKGVAKNSEDMKDEV